ncbi:hypothetical protein E2C01_042127 [Portunus trituberculatus]|uniref:Uncharacterized protein n=1 Tax=Portunus trituberculatus TaxID=210409 RepID=A0A5B7FSK9_PORTR|nr:hypothetical protein [Portunus trituberculatus]
MVTVTGSVAGQVDACLGGCVRELIIVTALVTMVQFTELSRLADNKTLQTTYRETSSPHTGKSEQRLACSVFPISRTRPGLIMAIPPSLSSLPLFSRHQPSPMGWRD